MCPELFITTSKKYPLLLVLIASGALFPTIHRYDVIKSVKKEYSINIPQSYLKQ